MELAATDRYSILGIASQNFAVAFDILAVKHLQHLDLAGPLLLLQR